MEANEVVVVVDYVGHRFAAIESEEEEDLSGDASVEGLQLPL